MGIEPTPSARSRSTRPIPAPAASGPRTCCARHDLAFEEVNLAKDPVGRRELVDFTGQMTFPQIIIDGRPLGGLQELEEADGAGRSRKLANGLAARDAPRARE